MSARTWFLIGLGVVVVILFALGVASHAPGKGLLAGIAVAGLIAVSCYRIISHPGFTANRFTIVLIASVILWFTLLPALSVLFSQRFKDSHERLAENYANAYYNELDKQSLKMESGDFVELKENTFVYGDDGKICYYSDGNIPIKLYAGTKVMIVPGYSNSRKAGENGEGMTLIKIPIKETGDIIGEAQFWVPTRKLKI